MVFNRQALFICAVFVVISLSQLGNIAAGDLAEESEILTSVMSKIGQIIGIIGIIGTLLTFPLMLIAAILEKITPLSLNTVFEILYLMLGVLIINSKNIGIPLTFTAILHLWHS